MTEWWLESRVGVPLFELKTTPNGENHYYKQWSKLMKAKQWKSIKEDEIEEFIHQGFRTYEIEDQDYIEFILKSSTKLPTHDSISRYTFAYDGQAYSVAMCKLT